MLVNLWYALVALTLAVYLVLDGFDLGAGILHLWVARNDSERRAVLRSIGPVWDANEVWLLAAGASTLLAFPVLFARAFSGFYLPLTFVMWLLLFRALGAELRHQLDHVLWTQFWDAAFAVASLLLVIFFGAALGNLVRGVSLDEAGNFFTPLWTNFRVDPSPGIVDWYTVSVALSAVSALTLHGALWLGRRFEGELQVRCKRAAHFTWKLTAGLTAVVAVSTFVVQEQMGQNLLRHPLWNLAPIGSLSALLGILWWLQQGEWTRSFLASCAYLCGMLACACAAIFPYALPPRGGSPGILLTDAASSPHELSSALYWWLPGMALVTVYFITMYRSLSTRVLLSDPDPH